jgi:general secretion pathway protein N
VAERALAQRLQQAGPLTWLLAACAGWALLLWAGALAGMGGRVDDPVAVAPSPLPQPGPVVADRMGPLAQYAEAASRPLFTQDRRPRSFLATSPDGEAGASPATTLEFVLTGVLISPQVRLAILQPTGGGDSQRVREGATPEGAPGWRLVEVQSRSAIFEASDGARSSVDLRTFGVAGAPGAARAAPVPPSVAPAPAPGAAMPTTGGNDAVPDQARIEAIRQRIEARRAQLRAGAAQAGASNAATTRPVPDANQDSSRPVAGEER